MWDINKLSKNLSPDQFREFQHIFNELIGYVKREEYDNILKLQERIQNRMGQAVQAQIALGQRMDAILSQHQSAKKQQLYQRCLNPEKTIPITHPFPLPPKINKKTEPSVLDASPTDSPVTPPASSPESPPLGMETLSQEGHKKLDTLMEDMARYNQDHLTSTEVDGMTRSTDSQVDALTPNQEGGPSQTMQRPSIPLKEGDPTQDDGVSLSEHLKDERLMLQEQKDRDAKRAKQVNKEDAQKKSKKQASYKNPNEPKGTQKRSQRIWDQIEEDQASGDIRHDL
jgi:hypothetical protein